MTIEQLAETCREYRKKANLSQGELADLADYEQCSISQFERGRKRLQLGTLIRLMDALNIKLKAGTVIINTPGDAYGVIGSAMLKKHWGNKELSEATGISVSALWTWRQSSMRGVYIDNALTAMRALKIDVSVIET